MRILKDFINGQITLDNNYTNDELLALLYMSYDSEYMVYLLNHDNSLINPNDIHQIIKHIKPDDKSKRFELIYDVLKVFNISFHDISTLCSQCISQLTLRKIQIDDLEISLHGFIDDEMGVTQYIFKINEKYYCNFHELYYDKNYDDVYSMMWYDIPVRLNGIYGVWDVDRESYYHSEIYFDHYDGNIMLQNVDCSDIEVYMFDDMHEFNKSEKLFETNAKLATQIYYNNLVYEQDEYYPE